MTTRTHFPAPLACALVALTVGCASSAGETGGPPGGSHTGGNQGSGGAGGAIIAFRDAAGDLPAMNRDAGSSQSSNLSSDAPTFKWDACTGSGCDAGVAAGGSAGSAAGGSVGAGGMGGAMSGSGGSSATASGGKAGSGGVMGSGGSISSAGGSTSSMGGRTGAGTGGSTAVGGGSGAPDAGVAWPDAAPDIGGKSDASTPPDAGRDLGSGGDVNARCVARLRALVPSTASFDTYPLVAGENVQVVLRAEIVSGGPPSPAWTWQAQRDGKLLQPITGMADRSQAAFPIAQAGTYVFTAVDNTNCSATVTRYAQPATACTWCNDWVVLRAAPPPGGDCPLQVGAKQLDGANVQLLAGESVSVSPSVAGAVVPAYVRISATGGELVADGLADPRSMFNALLLPTNTDRARLRYDVLVVPIDGSDGSTVAATAPQLFPGLMPGEINLLNGQRFPLSGGVTVTGTTTSADGLPVADARVILSNRNPAEAGAGSQLIFSSVGRTDTQGNFRLHVQPGQYWISFSPPSGQGLAEAFGQSPITVNGDTTLGFAWTASRPTTLRLRVLDAFDGSVADGTRVRVTSAQATTVGTLLASDGGSQVAQGNVRAEATTVNGAVTFANIPADAVYSVVMVPAALGPLAATTAAYVNAPLAGGEQLVRMAAQGRILGKLSSNLGSATDWSEVSVVAYDRSADTPEPAQAVSVAADGTFALGVSPQRPYVVVVVPGAASGLARTFVGPGALEATEFTVAQKVPLAKPYNARVLDASGAGLAGTALQAFCEATWPGCVDATVPLAETTAETGGSFRLILPDRTTQ